MSSIKRHKRKQGQMSRDMQTCRSAGKETYTAAEITYERESEIINNGILRHMANCSPPATITAQFEHLNTLKDAFAVWQIKAPRTRAQARPFLREAHNTVASYAR